MVKIPVAALIAEFCGTVTILFLGCLGCLPGGGGMQPALAFGAAVATAIQIFGHISGGHFNPAVTAAAVCFQLVSLPVGLLYIGAQLLGAMTGHALALFVGSQADEPAFCNTAPDPGASVAVLLTAEFAGTALLVLLCCCFWDERNKGKQDSLSIKFGLFIFIYALLAGHISGASLNPARTFGPSVISNKWESHWLYWVSPMSAGILVSLFYRIVFIKKTENI